MVSLFYCCKKVYILINKWLPEKEDFYSHLNVEDITDADYV